MRGHGPEPAPRRKPGEAAAAAASAEAEAWAAADLAGTTYCTCSRPSFGEMVCCDNPECAIEWFHYDCVSLDAAPDGVWLCPICVAEPHLAMQLASGDARASARGSRGGRSAAGADAAAAGVGAAGAAAGAGARGRGGGGGRARRCPRRVGSRLADSEGAERQAEGVEGTARAGPWQDGGQHLQEGPHEPRAVSRVPRQAQGAHVWSWPLCCPAVTRTLYYNYMLIYQSQSASRVSSGAFTLDHVRRRGLG